ncbi:MAG: sigma-54-dependent transcriptional regulator [Tepidimonas sp.]|uniref:sigma-54-dependent transcriptional regulator n=1 Tax=Tepidimonas sp. TaxID=2002775 RepID=UPI004054FA9B
MSLSENAAILIVEDEPDLRELYALSLTKAGHDAHVAANLAQAQALLQTHQYGVVLTDMRLPDGSGMQLLHTLAQQRRRERAIVVTAHGSVDDAVQALKAGAFDYLTKPVTPARLRQAVATALGASGTQGVTPAPAATGNPDGPGACSVPELASLIGDSPTMQAVRDTIARVARSMAPVLISGESGTGKERIARAVHACSHRAAGPFVPVNCGAIPAELLESELFGHRRGAFTGAHSDKRGLFQAAAGGTLFLDEVADLPLPMQAKLLRALQERAVRPVGATAEEPVDVRIVSATHKPLERLVHSGQFRHDLYYRLSVIPIHAPALREHLQDLPAIAADILARLAARDRLPHAPRLTDTALARLLSHDFPGNVRELENWLERALALHPGPELDARAFESSALPTAPSAPPLVQDANATANRAELHDAPLPRATIQSALERNRWNQSRTARELGWTLAKLRYWMQRMGLG